MYLGLDCGTSGLKALLTDDGGAPVASATCAYSPDRPQPGWSEQNPEVWRAAMAAAIADLHGAAGPALGALKAISFSGQMHGAVVLDRSDRPVRPAILHNDGRAIAEAEELARDHAALTGIVGVKPMPGFTGPKLLWLKKHEPDNWRRIECVLAPKDYLRLGLCGERGSDMSDAAGSGCSTRRRAHGRMRRSPPAAPSAPGRRRSSKARPRSAQFVPTSRTTSVCHAAF